MDDPAILLEHRALWEWRRRVADLYAEVRSSEPLPGWQRWCSVRDDLFRHHPQSPIPAEQRSLFAGVPCFAHDPSQRYVVALGEPDSRATVRMAAGRDGEVRLSPSRARADWRRTSATLTLYWIGGYGGGAFLPFRDATTGRESFGGGRYLIDSIKGADLGSAPDGRIILDFNFAYNPSCAYSEQWVCPLAPPVNTLPCPVRAGERCQPVC